MPDLLGDVVDLIGRVADPRPDEITVASRFDSFGSWTSLAALRLLMSIEDRFGVRLDLRAYFAAATVGDLVSLVSRGQQPGGTGAGQPLTVDGGRITP